MKVETLVVGPIQANCYLLYDEESKETAIIDPGGEAEKIIKWVNNLSLKPKYILNTHGHYDHVGANDKVREAFDIPVYICENDAHMLGSQQNFFGMTVEPGAADKMMYDGDELVLSGCRIEVILTPGHTKGGCVFYLPDEGICFSGDTVFKGTVGRTDLAGGSFEEIVDSVQNKLAKLPDDTVIYPGHGPKTTFAFERKHNPYFRWDD